MIFATLTLGAVAMVGLFVLAITAMLVKMAVKLILLPLKLLFLPLIFVFVVLKVVLLVAAGAVVLALLIPLMILGMLIAVPFVVGAALT